jgi:hypothetical protein
MKLSFIICLFATLSAWAGDAEITVSTLDIKRDKNGGPPVRYETTLRGKTRILVTRSELHPDGKYAVTMRSYYFGHELVMMESGEDRDGFFETLVLWHRAGDTEEIEA